MILTDTYVNIGKNTIIQDTVVNALKKCNITVLPEENVSYVCNSNNEYVVLSHNNSITIVKRCCDISYMKRKMLPTHLFMFCFIMCTSMILGISAQSIYPKSVYAFTVGFMLSLVFLSGLYSYLVAMNRRRLLSWNVLMDNTNTYADVDLVTQSLDLGLEDNIVKALMHQKDGGDVMLEDIEEAIKNPQIRYKKKAW